MELALPSSSESGLGEVDSSTISVVVDGKEKKRKPQSKYNDEAAMYQIKQQDVSKVNIQPSGSSQ